MDLDKPLDDMIATKKRSDNPRNTNNSNTRGGSKPRQSRERSDVPYAVCPLCMAIAVLSHAHAV
jgi:hypothetical protein